MDRPVPTHRRQLHRFMVMSHYGPQPGDDEEYDPRDPSMRPSALADGRLHRFMLGYPASGDDAGEEDNFANDARLHRWLFGSAEDDNYNNDTRPHRLLVGSAEDDRRRHGVAGDEENSNDDGGGGGGGRRYSKRARVPASSAAITGLKEVTAALLQRECAVCLNDFGADEDGEKLMAMPCSHTFHQDCIFRWLRINRVCPLCRHELPAEE